MIYQFSLTNSLALRRARGEMAVALTDVVREKERMLARRVV